MTGVWAAEQRYRSIAELAREKAIAAIHRGQPVTAREWLEVAATADAAAMGRLALAPDVPPMFPRPERQAGDKGADR